jgi:hypothetical protein
MNEPHEQGRLRSRPRKTPAGTAPVGLHTPGTEAGPAEVYLYVPAGYRTEVPRCSSFCTAPGRTRATASRR